MSQLVEWIDGILEEIAQREALGEVSVGWLFPASQLPLPLKKPQVGIGIKKLELGRASLSGHRTQGQEAVGLLQGGTMTLHLLVCVPAHQGAKEAYGVAARLSDLLLGSDSPCPVQSITWEKLDYQPQVRGLVLYGQAESQAWFSEAETAVPVEEIEIRREEQ